MGWREAFQCGSYLYIGLMLSSICVLKIQAQSPAGFISIDCGNVSYTDAKTKLTWESDSNYTATGLNGVVPFTVNSTIDNADALQTFRYFPGNRSKYCYELQLTTSNISVLIRAMFLHGSAPELTLPITFDASVNGTSWFQLSYGVDDSYDVLTTSVEYEGVFYSPGSVIHFCLEPQTGAPFISSLELRELTSDNVMYSFPGSSGQYMSLVWRYNCGAQFGSPTIRYPEDQFDRLWKSPGTWASALTSSSGTVSQNTYSGVNNIPPAVMQTAWLDDEPNTSFWFSLPLASSVSKVAANIYFEEIESTAAAASRIFDINLNGYNVYDQIASTFADGYRFYNWLVPGEKTNFTFTAASDATLGPIVNAVEVFALYDFSYFATAAEDVIAMAALQISFNLTDWQGDPCLPVSWNWVTCTADTTPRVDKLLLSNMGINAPIPPALSDLDALTEIYLDNNNLYGTIPDSLASLPNLTVLYLDDNNLTGAIPDVLLSKLGSNFYYYGNSLLGASPSGSPGSPASSATKKSSSIGIIIGAIVGGIVVVIVLVCLLTWIYCCSKTKKRERKRLPNEIAIPAKQFPARTTPLAQVKPQSPSVDGLAPHPPLVKPSAEVGHISYEEVQIATSNFKTKIGQGSYGSVFHGWINNREVAVKLNSLQSQQGHNEFITEVEILTRVHHRNLVSLIGYCDEGEELILIYEFEVNGTLKEWLSCDEGKTRGKLDWKRRLQIAGDGAKGLEYLHKGCDPTIIHRDVKSSNILLDESMTAKVADFGLSKSAPTENTTGFSTGVKGTPGYLDPEYHHMGKLTHKSDVYSYGVVLAELITGPPPFKIEAGSRSVILVDYLRKMMETNDIEALADPNLRGSFNPESMWRMADLALTCVNLVGVRRPDFTQVVQGINEAIDSEKNFTVHSPFAQSGSYIPRSGSLHRYQNLH